MASLEELYREVILDHYRAPRNRGELSTPPAIKAEGKNPVCGDELTLYLDIKEGTVTDVKMSGQGCSISMASASMMTSAIKGKTIEQARTLIAQFKDLMHSHGEQLDNADHSAVLADSESISPLGELDALRGVVKFPVRIKCATLPFATLDQGLSQATGEGNEITSTEE